MIQINIAWPAEHSGGHTVLDTAIPDEGASFRFTTPAGALNPGAGWIGVVVHPDGANPCMFDGGLYSGGQSLAVAATSVGTAQLDFRGSPKTGGKKDKHHDLVLQPDTDYEFNLTPRAGSNPGAHPVRCTLQRPKKEGHEG